jgi:hypothetical protein
MDRCPQESGPADRGGCPLPEEQPTEERQPLPLLPTRGPCVMATQGYIPVNIRKLPSTTAPVVGIMDPYQFYPVYYFFDNSEGERWNQTNGGLAAGWVTRLGGICRGLPVLTFDAGDPENASVQLVSQFGLSMDELMFNPQPEPPADPTGLFMPEDFPFPDPEASGQVLMARFGPDSSAEALLLPAIQNVIPTDEPTESAQVFVKPGELVGFNPQPEPPANPFAGMYFEILFGAADVPPEENNAGDGAPGLLMTLTAMNLGPLSVQTCESAMFPAEGELCTYFNDMGQVAACFTSDMNTFCIYSHPPEPG